MKIQQDIENFRLVSTPPSTSSEGDQTPGPTPEPTTGPTPGPTPRHRLSGQKRARSAKTRNYRKIKKLTLKITEMKKREEKYKKRCQRLKSKLNPDGDSLLFRSTAIPKHHYSDAPLF